MGVMLNWQNKTVLDCANRVFEILYNTILEEIYNKNMKFNHDVRELIEDLGSGCNGIGCDIAEYIHSQEDFLIFLNLVEDAVTTIFSQQNTMHQYKHFYDNFLHQLKIAYKNFEPNPFVMRSANGTYYALWDPTIKIKIKFNKRYILACSRETYNPIYKQLLKYVNEDKLSQSGKQFLSLMIHGHVGICLDFINFDLSKDDILILVDILCQSIKNVFLFNELSPTDSMTLNNFYRELSNIKNKEA